MLVKLIKKKKTNNFFDSCTNVLRDIANENYFKGKINVVVIINLSQWWNYNTELVFSMEFWRELIIILQVKSYHC